MKRRLPIALAVAGLFVAGSVNALGIDGFDQTEMVLVGHNPTPLSDSGLVSNAIGGARKFTLTNVTNASLSRTATALIDESDSNKLSISNADGVNSTVTVIWDGTTADPYAVVTNGLNSADLTVGNGTAFLFNIPSIDLNVNLALTVWDSQGNFTVIKNAPSPGIQLMPFADFVGIDFTDIGAIRIVLDGPAAWDGSIDLVGTNGTTPLPGTLLLMGAGLLGLVRHCRRVGSSA